MENLPLHKLLLSVAIVLAAHLIGDGLKGHRYVVVGQYEDRLLDSATGTMFIRPDVGNLWAPRYTVPK